MQKYATCLWFDGQAEEAAKFYVSIFPNSRVIDTLRWDDVGPGPKGSVLTCDFELDGRHYFALNGGPQYHFTPAISLVINCETQAEVDHYWNHFLKGGKEQAFTVGDNLAIIVTSNNLGDAKSIIAHPATTTHQRFEEPVREEMGITQSLLRLSSCILRMVYPIL